jgi:hypothetical protein
MIDPFGGLNAYEINVGTTGGSSRSSIYQPIAGGVALSTFTHSIWVRSASGTSAFSLGCWTGSVIVYSSNFTATTTWTRFEFAHTNMFSQFQITPASGGGTVGNILVFGAQLERSSTARAYIPTTTAAVFGPRFDHNPATLASLGLLIEESRTNQIIQSEDLGTTWSTDGGKVAVATNVIASPSGATNADKITENSVLLERKILIGGVTAVASTVYTYSCFLKAGERDVAQLAFGGTFGNQFQNFIIGGVNAGTLGSGSGITSPQITALPNGWYRCTATITSAGAGATQVTIGPSDSSTLLRWGTYVGTVGSGIFAWGAQLEVGAFPTSYIPTTTASVVRSADLCSISGSNFTGFWNQSAGTLVETFEASPNTNTTYVSASNGNIVQNSLHLDNDTGLMRAVYYSGSSLVAALDLGSVGTVGATNTIATAYSVNDFAASRNGGTVVTDTSGAVPASLSQINIGTDERSQTPTSFYSNRCIKSLRYYKKRLANAKLQTLST